jgi:hypothetical protein
MKGPAILVSIILIILSLGGPIYAETVSPVDLFKQTCSQCHSLKRINSKTKTKTGWQKTVDRMLKKLASRDEYIKINQEGAKQIAAYLYSQWGYTNSKVGDIAAERRKKKFREQYPASKPRTVSPKAKTVK